MAQPKDVGSALVEDFKVSLIHPRKLKKLSTHQLAEGHMLDLKT